MNKQNCGDYGRDAFAPGCSGSHYKSLLHPSVLLSIFVCLTLSVSANSQQSYIGLYTDENRMNSCVFNPGGFYQFDMWIWCHPGTDGQICAEFMIEYPSNAIQSTLIPNTDIISVTLGTLFDGMSVCYTECQHDWNWCFRQTLYLTDTEVSYIRIRPHPDVDQLQFANCLGGYPAEQALVLNDLNLNTCWHWPPRLSNVIVESPSTIRAIFDQCVQTYEHPYHDCFILLNKNDQSDTLRVFRAKQTEDYSSEFILLLETSMTDNTTYILEADGICCDCHGCADSEMEFLYSIEDFEDLPDLALIGLDADMHGRALCAPYNFSFSMANCGFVPCGMFRVLVSMEYWSGGAVNDVSLDSINYDGLSTGEVIHQDVTVILPPILSGHRSLYLTVKVDDLEQVTEITEINNSMDSWILNYCPEILSIMDLPEDDGGWVEIEFTRSHADQTGIEGISVYEILRKIDPLPGNVQTETANEQGINANKVEMNESNNKYYSNYSNNRMLIPEGWELVGEVPADLSDIYSMAVLTAADSTEDYGMHWSVYMVRAVRPTPDTTVHYVSCPDSGYSVANKSVATRLRSFLALFKASAIEITWQLSEMNDGVSFCILRCQGESDDFLKLNSQNIIREGLTYMFSDWDIEYGEKYRYRIDYLEEGKQEMLFETKVLRTPKLPVILHQNRPNPFNPSTSICYYLPVRCNVRIEIYNAAGRLIKVLKDGEQSPGNHSVDWNGTNTASSRVSSGIYFYRLTASKEAITKKMVLLK